MPYNPYTPETRDQYNRDDDKGVSSLTSVSVSTIPVAVRCTVELFIIPNMDKVFSESTGISTNCVFHQASGIDKGMVFYVN